MAKVLFVHPQFPGQFLWLARHLAGLAENSVKALIAAPNVEKAPDIPGVEYRSYGSEVVADRPRNHALHDTETFVRNAASAAIQAEEMKRQGFQPDVIYTHSSWGIGAFLHNVFPRAKQVKYCEWYYNRPNVGIRFLKKNQPLERLVGDDLLNLPILAELAHFDRLIAPTRWQRDQFPPVFKDKIEILPDGLDDRLFSAREINDRQVSGLAFSDSDEVVTYVARGADSFRGFESFLKAVAYLQAKRPNTRFVIAGDTRAFYGPEHGTDQHFQSVLGNVQIDRTRVHFLGTIARDDYVRLLRVSDVHVYLTVPFVLSWSLLEAMAAGCAIVASDTPPVAEFIRHGINGYLVDYFDSEAIGDMVETALNDRQMSDVLARRARSTVQRQWSTQLALRSHMTLLTQLL